uniref:Endonuclease/exonuclease/phosphatase domain-containing protein n=1 Tax=Arundo donax TaxID=35708 RepID=A0A0A8ZJ87_ARUDO
MSTEWEQNYPLCTVQALVRDISDHGPLFLDSRDASHRGNLKHFEFELCWLTREGFNDLVAKVWKNENKGNSEIDRWQNKICQLR